MSDKRIKLVQIIADSELGGGPAHVLGILKNIDKNKFGCHLICPKGYLANEAKLINGLNVINLKFGSKFDIQTIQSLKKELEKIQSSSDPFAPMVVHSHGPRAGLFASLVAPTSTKKFFTEHNYTAGYRISNRINDFVQRQMMSFVYRKSNRVIAVSSAVKSYLLSQKVSKEKIEIIHNAVNMEDFAGEKKKEFGEAPVIGNISNLLKQKGQIYLIRALPKILEKYPAATVQIVGEGEERINLEREIQTLGLGEHVVLLGQKKDAKKYLSDWDIFAFPSTAEPFGIAILEAMQAGVPVVASKVDGIVDIIENNKNGILVESKDPQKLADAILMLLDNSKLSERLTSQAFKDLKNFDWQVKIKEIESSYLNS